MASVNNHQSHAPWPIATGVGPPDGGSSWYGSLPEVKLSASTMVLGFLSLVVLYGAVNPKHAKVLHPAHFINHLRRRYKAWSYLFNGPGIVHDGFHSSNSKPFEVLAPDTRYVYVSDPKHIKEVESAPDTTLSLYAASLQVLQPQYTMQHFNFYDTPPEGMGFIRAVRTLLTNNIPTFLPELRRIIDQSFGEFHAGHEVVDGARHTPIFRTITKVIVRANVFSIFGEELAQDPEFVELTLEYAEQLVVTSEIVRVFPVWLRPVIGAIAKRRYNAQKQLFDTLVPVIKQRRAERERASHLGEKAPVYNDCIQYILSSSASKTPRTAEGVAHELMALWFASVHPTSVTAVYAIEDLCLHPEYLEPLREELASQLEGFVKTGQGLPLLDSFIKESARLSPVESQATRRCAIVPFTLSDGTHLAPGDWACTPVAAIMQNPEAYPQPQRFSGFRFAPQEAVDGIGSADAGDSPRQPKPSRLIDVDDAFYMWGSGRQTCPGRFYGTALVKTILAHLIQNYDFYLADPDAPRWFTWRTCRVPKEGTMVVFTPREACR